MTQQDNWRPELARMAQRQDQVERQHRETTTRVDALNRDVEFRIDSLRREMDRQFRDRDWRVSSLERSRDTYENLFWFSMPLVAAVAVIIVLVIAVVASPEQRQETGEPEQRSPSFINAPIASSGGPLQPDFIAAGTPFRQHHRYPGNQGLRSREPDIVNPPPVKNRHRLSINPVESTVSTPAIRHLLRHRARWPGLTKALIPTQRWSQGRRPSTGVPIWLVPGAGSSPPLWSETPPELH